MARSNSGHHFLPHQGRHVGKADKTVGMTLHEAGSQVVSGAAVGMKDVENAAFVDANRVHGPKHFGRIVDEARTIPPAHVAMKIDYPSSRNHRILGSPRMRSRFSAQRVASALGSSPK